MSYSTEDLLYLMKRLRDPDGGCPWDLAQDFASITPSTVEEAYETVDAIMQLDTGGSPEQVKEELGDLLFQVIFYSQMGQEKAWFSFESIVDTLCEKLIRRHPHVFPDGQLHERFSEAPDMERIRQQWEDIKEEERRSKALHGVLDDVPRALPALSRAQKMQKRASRVGFDWDDARSALSKIREELDELEQAMDAGQQDEIRQEFGDLLFSCVNVGRHMKLDCEAALDGTNRKFEQRFGYIESRLKEQNLSLEQASLMEMDALWDEAKVELAKN